MKQTKIAIIGAGAVGTTTAYTLILKNIPAEIILVDIDAKRCMAEVLDLDDAVPFCKTSSIKAGSMQDAQTADIVIIAAGARQKEGQPRSELLAANKKIITDILTQLKPQPHTIIIMVTNPVDALTWLALKLTNLPATQIFGSGTLLDSLRLRGLLACKFDISERSIHAYILGDHGENQFPAWSLSTIGGTPLINFPLLDQQMREGLAQETRDKVYKIIEGKGATFFGVASCVAALCENIIYDQKRVTPVSCLCKEYGVCLNVPVVIGKNGIEKYLPLSFSEEEKILMKKAAQAQKELCKNL
jgi:L-lactate dehydrogenase